MDGRPLIDGGTVSPASADLVLGQDAGEVVFIAPGLVADAFEREGVRA